MKNKRVDENYVNLKHVVLLRCRYLAAGETRMKKHLRVALCRPSPRFLFYRYQDIILSEDDIHVCISSTPGDIRAFSWKCLF